MPQQRFAFLPLPQGHGSFRLLRAIRTSSVERSMLPGAPDGASGG
jgi:hypothetical protein